MSWLESVFMTVGAYCCVILSAIVILYVVNCIVEKVRK
jgi:hypothetical protein